MWEKSTEFQNPIMPHHGDVQLKSLACPACGGTHGDVTMRFHVGLFLADRCDYKIVCPINGHVVWIGRKDWHDTDVALLAITRPDGDARIGELRPLLHSQLQFENDGIHLSLLPS